MHGIISDLKVLFIHPQINETTYQNTNQACYYGVPGSYKTCTDELVTYLFETLEDIFSKEAVKQARRVVVGESIHHSQKIGFSQDAGEDSTENSGHCMRVEDPQCVVYTLEEC
ncbi:hypothetical protein Dsin_011442 [Dipteronia sinensis]|uniref:Uncharacterized protein n=1 Tax=Dipteronia sinensis TaxID=43782 RepID=A0AAE0AUL9_9ROSI|nr:hypothetical protein Dsin_011442 [Dipteronia sinensis]